MKKHKREKNGNGHVSQSIRIEFTHPTATAVAIAGSFNDWRPDVTQMVRVGDGRWLKDLALPPGTYEYLMVADGRWLPDPSTKETVPNPFGGVNSLLTVPIQRTAVDETTTSLRRRDLRREKEFVATKADVANDK